MKLARMMFAGLLALNTVSTGALAGPSGKSGPIDKAGQIDRSRVHAQKKKLREVTAAAFMAQADADPELLLAELQKTGLKITELNTLDTNAIASVAAVLTMVSTISGGDVDGIRLRLEKGNQLLIRIGKVTAAQPAKGKAGEAPAEDDDV